MAMLTHLIRPTRQAVRRPDKAQSSLQHILAPLLFHCAVGQFLQSPLDLYAIYTNTKSQLIPQLIKMQLNQPYTH